MLKLKAVKNEKIDNEVFVKREDLIHPYVSGNKYRKLNYNIQEAFSHGYDTLLTFGGAYSNHVAALASAGASNGFKTIGVIRGEELKDKIDDNPTLSFAKSRGMQFKFVSRMDYRQKNSKPFIQQLNQDFGEFYTIPEGGTNALAIKGCEEILTENDYKFDYICCAVGTGGTISGLINSALPHQKILGFPALKGDFLKDDIRRFATSNNWDLISSYHFGGYAKINSDLVTFINQFKEDFDVLLDPVYTGKMMYGIFDLRSKGFFNKGSKILAIHTGGLQGIKGMNVVLEQKGLPRINE